MPVPSADEQLRHKLDSDSNFATAYWDRGHPGHDGAVAWVTEQYSNEQAASAGAEDQT